MSTVSDEFEKWMEEYKPIPNHLSNDNPSDDGSSLYFETYGEDIEYVKSKVDVHNVWTWVDGDGGSYVIAGFQWVNRIGFFVTEKPWENESLVVPYDIYD